MLTSLLLLALAAACISYLHFPLHIHGLDSLDECDEHEEYCVAYEESEHEQKTSADTVSIDCIDRHDKCEVFRRNNGCETSPGWMIVNCPISCNACHLRDPNVRCRYDRLNISEVPAFRSGDLNKFFQRTKSLYGTKYKIVELSRDPWILLLQNFITNAEINGLLEKGTKWERSTDVGSPNKYGEDTRVVSNSHTSTTSWCRTECDRHASTKRLTRKISLMTNVSSSNFELYQLLKYEVGQRYGPHFDYIPNTFAPISGARVLTFILYLSDVEGGGETYFPHLNITITPKRGNAVLFANTLDEDPGRLLESRSYHEAKPVLKGVKYAANAWIHQFDFKAANLWGCTGAFDKL